LSALENLERPKAIHDEPRKDVKSNAAEQEQEDLEKQRKQLENVSLEQDIKERKAYALKVYRLICVWLGVIAFPLFLQGCSETSIEVLGLSLQWRFSLSDQVLITLISGTTINILGIFIIVVKYLFHSNK
jgi:hypothetical protein